ncbi:OmpA family protein [Proteiniphilum sp. UBA5384]|uniref:OmpA family protein n=1 Tax=Proteiniphilum sp. UBA5384 TaxID=1947279 RepID=UPI0025E98A26|nr:DUF3868 domain-containing protein [Proteiniphilum sp. UBA5384]
MKLKYLLFLLLFFPIVVPGQTGYLQYIRVDNQEFIQEEGMLSIAFDLILDRLEVKSEQMMYITPRLTSSQGDREIILSPVLLVGSARSKVLERMQRLQGKLDLDPMPRQIIKRSNGRPQQVVYREIIPYEPWMRKSSLDLLANLTGCASCDEGSDILLIADNFIKEPFIPKINYVSPVVQPTKRAVNFLGIINFRVDEADILPDYKNNAVPIKRANDLVSGVKNIEGARITAVEIVGYASPEASMDYNKKLSVRRANAFADYIAAEHELPRNMMRVSGRGEDWEELKLQIEASSLRHKQQVLDIIDNIANPDERDEPLKKLDGGSVYQILLHDYYPRIRRIEMNIDYEVEENFNLAQVKERYKERPSEMSLNEYYFLSQQYQAGSDRFNELFAEALKHHPDDVIVSLNVAVAKIEDGEYSVAIERLKQFENEPKVWNVLGAGYALMEDYDKAKDCFFKAAEEGDALAKQNMEQLIKYIGE